ncbi:phosphodiester glycosidase family protein [Limisphaera sp. 4302-co]
MSRGEGGRRWPRGSGGSRLALTRSGRWVGPAPVLAVAAVLTVFGVLIGWRMHLPVLHGAAVRFDARDIPWPGVTFRVVVLEKPRPVRVHEVVLDLDQRVWEPAASVAPDPDGPGGAEAQLMSPLELAARAGLFLAVNANAFAWSDGRAGERAPVHWREGMRVDILGWAHDGRRQASPPERTYWSFWQETGGRVRLGQVGEGRPVRWAVAGFDALVMAGQEVPVDGRARHPRTAVGLDVTGRRMWWVVVDGRRPGYSEGMTLQELASWMRRRGCHEAVNLDGGGSSVLLMRDGDGRWRVCNRPSEGAPRPVPVLVGLRLREAVRSGTTNQSDPMTQVPGREVGDRVTAP